MTAVAAESPQAVEAARSATPDDTGRFVDEKWLSIIDDSPVYTAFEKRVLSLLCQIPRGSVSTYGVMAAWLKSSPRAIGNVMRKNRHAPHVPCHRVVASGGRLGGYKGVKQAAETSKASSGGGGGCVELAEKRNRLRQEGVRFDSAGRVMGTPFRGFHA